MKPSFLFPVLLAATLFVPASCAVETPSKVNDAEDTLLTRLQEGKDRLAK